MSDTHTPDQKRVSTIVKAIAVVIILPPVIHGMMGYHPSDVIWMIPMCLIGSALYFIGDRIG